MSVNQRNQRQVLRFMAPHLISVKNGARALRDDRGRLVKDEATCLTCGLTWNDALISGTTPAPSARCPYEYWHEEIARIRRGLNSETNTPSMQKKVLTAARLALGVRKLQADFEHGHWWITRPSNGAQYSVNDTLTGFDFEQVTRGDDDL